MTYTKNDFEPDTAEMYNEIVALDAELMDVFESQLSISPFLSRKIVSFQGNKNRPAYSWYKYKEAFSAGLVEYILGKYEGCSQGKLLDPFAGIGTSLFAASENGVHADGIELLPIGQELINTRILLQKGLSSDDTATLERWVSSQPWEGCQQRVPFSTIKLLNSINTYLEYEKSSGKLNNNSIPRIKIILSRCSAMVMKLNNNSIPRMVRGYFSEMACVIGECYRLLKPYSRLFMVNDNVRYASIGISVDLILSDIARSIGFEVEKILIVPGRKGNSSQQMGTYGCIPLRKCVYVWRKGSCH